MPTNEAEWFQEQLKLGNIEVWHGGQIAFFSEDRMTITLHPIGFWRG